MLPPLLQAPGGGGASQKLTSAFQKLSIGFQIKCATETLFAVSGLFRDVLDHGAMYAQISQFAVG